MYVQHPFKFDGKYYAKIDDNFYEISKEVAMAMLSSYRKEVYRSRKWAPEEDDSEEDEMRIKEEDAVLDQFKEFQDVEVKDKNKDKDREPVATETPKKKWKRKTKYVEILDCAFSENADGVSVADLPDEKNLSVEDTVIVSAEIDNLNRMLAFLSEQEQFIIRSVFYEDMQQKEVAELLGMSKQLLNKRLQIICRKLRSLFETEKY